MSGPDSSGTLPPDRPTLDELPAANDTDRPEAFGVPEAFAAGWPEQRLPVIPAGLAVVRVSAALDDLARSLHYLEAVSMACARALDASVTVEQPR